MPASRDRNGPADDRQAGALAMTEIWWRDRYTDIERNGYMLRPQYHPHWEASWSKPGKDFNKAEGGQATTSGSANATRIRDRRQVMLMKVLPDEAPHELTINQSFSSQENSRSHDNHCTPLLGVLELSMQFGSQKLMVFPLLRPFNRPPIQTFGEFVAFFTQICEGIRFMHQRKVAHRDCTTQNIRVTVVQRLPRYYFIDFGLSRRYPSRDAMDEPLPGQDESAPEHRSGRRRLCNPFHTDIYYIGNVVRREFMEKCNDFEFMEDLVASMTQEDPVLRPSIEDVLQEFSYIKGSLSKGKLRSAIISKNCPKILGIIRQARQFFRTLRRYLLPASNFGS